MRKKMDQLKIFYASADSERAIFLDQAYFTAVSVGSHPSSQN